MKGLRSAMGWAVVAAFIAVAALSCSNAFLGQAEDGDADGTGYVVVRLPGSDEGPRYTILPGEGAMEEATVRYRVELTREGWDDVTAEWEADEASPDPIAVPVGSWNLVVEALSEANPETGERLLVGRFGPELVEVEEGEQKEMTVVIEPRREGSGTLRARYIWDDADADGAGIELLTYPDRADAGADIEAGTDYEVDGETVTLTLELAVDSGTYLLTVRPRKDGVLQRATVEIVRIYDTLVSEAVFDFTGTGYAGIPPAPLALTAMMPIEPDRVQLAWEWDWETGPNTHEGFRVFRDGEEIADVGNRFATGYGDTGFVPGAEHHYAVRAYNDFGLSEAAEVVFTPPTGDVVLTIFLEDPDDPEFSFDVDAEDLVLDRGVGETLSVIVQEEFDTYQWLLNGEEIGQEQTVDISSEGLVLGPHTVTLIVEDEGDLHSETPFDFLVVDNTMSRIIVPDHGNQRIVAMNDMDGNGWRELALEYDDGAPVEQFYPWSVTAAGRGRVVVVGSAQPEQESSQTGYLVGPAGELNSDGEEVAVVEEELDWATWHQLTEAYVGNRIAFDDENGHLYYAVAGYHMDPASLYRWVPGSGDDPEFLEQFPEESFVTALEVSSDGESLYVGGWGTFLDDSDGVARVDAGTGGPSDDVFVEVDDFPLVQPVDVRLLDGVVYVMLPDAVGPSGSESVVFAVGPEDLEFTGNSFGTLAGPASIPDAVEDREFYGPLHFTAALPGQLVVLDRGEDGEVEPTAYSRLVTFAGATGEEWDTFRPEEIEQTPGFQFFGEG